MLEFSRQYGWLYLEGAIVSIHLTVLTMAAALIIGLGVALCRLSDTSLISTFGAFYVALFRGVPPLLMIYIVYFGIPAWAQTMQYEWLIALTSPLDNRFISAIVAIAIISGAYSAEIIRASILSVPVEQEDASRSIGMSYWLSLRRIILPQAIRVAFAPLGNETITVLKGTSLVSVIGVTELMRTAQLAASATFQNLTAYTFAGLFYLSLVIIIQIIVQIVESRLRLSNRSR